MPIPHLHQKYSPSQKWRKTKHKKSFFVFRFFSFKRFIIFSFFCGLIGAFVLFLYVAWISRELPDPNSLINREIPQSTKIYDRTGETVLYEIHGAEKRTLVELKDIPDYVKWATIAIEDKDFYKHKGFSLWAIFRTAITNILTGKKAGGSTLTQQLIKNAVLTSEKTYTRKIKELILAYRVEKKFSKDEILQMYLNEIPYGSTAYGVEAASQRYFGKSVRDINLAEAAILAALPQAPSRYSPYGNHKDLLIARQHYILDLMVEQGYISAEEAEEAKNYELKFKKQTTNIIAPHFVMYVKELLAEKYGEKMIEQGGLKIYTTLDLYKQKIAEETIDEFWPKWQEKYNASNAALLSIDPKTGQVLAMVGSRDYFNDEIDGQVNITTRPRQPGSSLKPLVYATAFIKGYTPSTILYDVVTNFSSDPNEPYEPHNYDNEEHGPITMKKALAGSLNIPAVKAIYLAGIDNVLNLAADLGYTTLKDRKRFGLSLVLGGGEVKMIEHVNAYSAFAREGIIHPVSVILKIEDSKGRVIEEFKPRERKVFEPQIARLINDILSDNSARAYAFGEHNWLTLGDRPVAAKTGTTNDYRDAWTVGYTPSIVTGVWVGNNDNSPMKRGAAGGVVAAPIWHKYMERILGDTPVEYFKEPKEEKTGKPVLDGEIGEPIIVKIDKASGRLATEYTPPEMIEERVYREAHCILYYVDKDDPRGDSPTDPTQDPQFELWEKPVQEWAKKQLEEGNASTTALFSTSTIPTEYDNLHIPENIPHLEILEPGNKQPITSNILEVKVRTSAPRGIDKVEYYIDGNLVATVKEYPFNLKKDISFLNNGYHNLKVRACDDIDNCREESLEFNLSLSGNQQKEKPQILWVEPTNGLAITNFDFPLKLKFKILNPDQIVKINVYYTLNNNQPHLIKSISGIPETNLSISWDNPPNSGTYHLYAEFFTWGGIKLESDSIILIVTNINQSSTASSTP